MSSILFTNVFVIDGSGQPGAYGEVLVNNGIIRQISYLRTGIGCRAADTVIDGQELCLSPGFIDAHGHSDISLLAAPDAFGKISQGITTELAGNCGLSPFPITDLNREHLEQLWRSYNEKLTWHDYQGYKTELLRRNPAINLYVQCGHNTLRSAVAGYETKQLNAVQLNQMKQLLLSNLQQGASGFSTGLLYTPGIFAPDAEIVELLKVLAPFLRVYSTHLRSEGDRLLESVSEAINACKSSGQRYLHLSHLKTAKTANHGKLADLLQLITANQSDFLHITADRYPYVESLTQLSVALPAPYDELDDISLMNKLQNPAYRHDLIQALKNQNQERLNSIRLVSTSAARYRRFSGIKLVDIANELHSLVPELLTDILSLDAPGAMAAFCGMSSENMRQIIMQKYVSCGTDESSRPADYSLGVSHPRGFGSMPRFINLLKQNDFTLEQAIAKITSLPAAIFNLTNRGRLQADMMADLVLFNPDKLRAMADFTSPHTPADGIEQVYVNGKLRYKRG